jgi:peptidoglycan hydrolase CwlO-like protein
MMSRLPSRLRILYVACLVLAVVLAPAGVCAAPATPGAIAQRLRDTQAKAAKAAGELAAMRSELTSALASFDDADTGLEAARLDLATTAERLGQLDAEIAAHQTAFDARVIAVYKSGRYEVVEALLSAGSFSDFLSRMDLLAYIQQADADLLTGLATVRSQGAVLQGQQAQRESELIAMRQQADARKAQVEASVAKQEVLTRSLSADVLRLVKAKETADAAAAAQAAAGATGGSPPPVPFQPNTLITDANHLASGSLSAEGIQAFLDRQSGVLKSYTGRDHAGATKTAAQMIAEAASAWGVSPRVILVTLQKEQSLLSQRSPSQYAYDWAMGCGKTDSVTYTKYQGFGNQIWGGAQKLISNRAFWYSGISISIDGKAVYPTNASTHALYRYTPHFGGATSFWTLYWRYFGDPLR